jgi:hypothetical protein
MSTAQELMFLEGFGSSHSQFILSVRVRSIVESAPEDRSVSLVETLKLFTQQSLLLVVRSENLKGYTGSSIAIGKISLAIYRK